MKYKMGIHQYALQWATRTEEKLTWFTISSEMRQRILRILIIVVVFATGVIGVILNSVYTLRAAFGSLIILAFLRYRYALLIAWALINAFIGSSLTILTGNNFLTGLTVPTLLLMTWFPLKQTFKRMPALVYLLIYLAWVFASIGISAIGIGSFLTLWFTFLDYVAVAVLTINVLTTKRRLLGLIDAILLVSMFIALYGIYGYITKHNGTQDSTPGIFRIMSIFGSSQTLALFLSVVIPLALYRTFTLQGFKRLAGLIVILILLVTLGLTFTRGAYICVALSIVIIVFFLPSRKMKTVMLGGILVLVVVTVLLATIGHIPIFSRFFEKDILTLNGRIYLWQALLDHFDPTQLLGNGLGASDVLLANLRVSDSGIGIIATAPHNLFLGALYDHGVVGVILLVLVFVRLIVSLITGMRKATGDHIMVYATAFVVLVSVLLQSLETRDLWIQGVGIYFWIVMALPFAFCWFAPKQTPGLQDGHEQGGA